MQKEITKEERNKAVLSREMSEAWTRGNLDIIDELVASDYVMHDPSQPGEIRGREALKQYIVAFRTAFPDLQMAFDDMVVENDSVATRVRLKGTHNGPLVGIPATGREVSVWGLSIDRLQDGKIVETHVIFDLTGLLRQIGIVPPLDEGGLIYD